MFGNITYIKFHFFPVDLQIQDLAMRSNFVVRIREELFLMFFSVNFQQVIIATNSIQVGIEQGIIITVDIPCQFMGGKVQEDEFLLLIEQVLQDRFGRIFKLLQLFFRNRSKITGITFPAYLDELIDRVYPVFIIIWRNRKYFIRHFSEKAFFQVLCGYF